MKKNKQEKIIRAKNINVHQHFLLHLRLLMNHFANDTVENIKNILFYKQILSKNSIFHRHLTINISKGNLFPCNTFSTLKLYLLDDCVIFRYNILLRRYRYRSVLQSIICFPKQILSVKKFFLYIFLIKIFKITCSI